ncbi:uncharacterized protein LOC126909686 [Daktulosphaira vitifoliae]|uniref:uncharacterized protein LOC126909686 n=1 Tax=Daktulosphaira vitifoliae TaxID=58002 RepID=UPI0021A9EB7A|nr:uncharacterized protein LOC126909686 [Daktulosphaira vitifoliae]
MLPKLFYSICYTFWILTTTFFVSCRIKPKTYEKYYSEVMDYISEQVGWDYMQSLEINSSTETSSNIKDVICKGSRTILPKKFDAVIDTLNYMYAEVIKTFIDHISTIANQCQEYYDINQGDNLLRCTVLLQSDVEISKTMFKQLYNVMNYLSNIDFKLLAKWKKTFSVPIVDEIYTFLEYATLKSQQNTQIFVNPNDPNTKNDACEVILEVKSFIEGKGFETYQKIKGNNNSVVYNHKPKFLLEENLKDYNARQNKNIELSEYLSEWLKIYYDEISTNLYKNLGFEKVLELNEASFKHPVHLYENTSQNQVIEQLNEITNESGWKSLNHINIIFNGQVISVERILRHTADKKNFHCKKEHILRVIKCIYTEILFKYCDYVNYLFEYCETENSKGNPEITYIVFVRKIFETVHKTTNIFDIMYKTLISLNELVGDYFHENISSNIKSLCSSITKFLEEINSGNYSLDILDSKNNAFNQVSSEIYTRQCVRNISPFLKFNKLGISSLPKTHEKQCLLQNFVLNIDIPESISTDNFSSVCNKLIVFSNNFTKVYYEDLGLNKFN